MKKLIADYRRALELACPKKFSLRMSGGGHYVARVERCDGAIRKFIFSSTPSDGHGWKNTMKLVRRWLADVEIPQEENS
jgi:hypothetical protein